MDKIVSISFGELFLKGRNRKRFIDLAKSNINKAIKNFNVKDSYSEHSKYYIEVDEEDIGALIDRLGQVFGIAYVSPTLRCDKTVESMEKAIGQYIREYGMDLASFKINTNRADKSFKPKSPDLNNIFGGYVLKNFNHLKVDVHNPDIEVNVDIRTKNAYIYGKKFQGAGGLPVGSSGKGLSLLSGGIDSPVASYMIAKRGVVINGLHFNSYPFTSHRSLEKVKQLGQTIAKYSGDFKLYNVNLLNIQKEINEKCRKENMTILSRRFMMRIGDEIAKRNGYKMLVTGESLGQVASQTIEGLRATDSVTDTIVLRPLIGMDKEEIIKIAQDIGSYELSILPYEDCCTVFQPDNPNIKPSIEELEEEEANLHIESLVGDSIDQMEVIDIRADH